MEGIANTPYMHRDAVSDDMLNADGHIGLLGKKFIDPEKVKFTWKNVERAKEWSEKSLLAIIYPTNNKEELEKCYDDYMLMAHPLRRKADTACIEFFGMECEDLYEYLKSNMNDGKIIMMQVESASMTEKLDFKMPFYKRYMQNIHTESNLDIAYTASRLLYNDGNRYNETLISNCISDVIDNHKDEVEITPDLPLDCPIFTPEEMIDFGVFADVDADNYFGTQPDNTVLEDLTSVKEWFEHYKNAYRGIEEHRFSEYSSVWMNTVRTLCRELKQFKEAGDTLRVKARMQSILELGWNPYLDFNAHNRTNSYKRIRSITSEAYGNKYRIADITTMIPLAEASEDKIEENDKDLVPVYLTLVAGDSPLSKPVQIITNCKYSHATISFDSELDKMYSFGSQQLASATKPHGLTIENMKKYSKAVKVSVYTFFVKPRDYVNMKSFIDKFTDDPDKTSYSFLNLFTYIFRIPLDRGDSYVCSQFVDKVLKVADIDITNKNSAFVSPRDFYESTKKNKGTIYKLYDGFAYKFKPSIIRKRINTLLRKATPIREMSGIDDDIGFIRATFENINDINTLRYLSSNVNRTHNPLIKGIYEEFINPVIDIQHMVIAEAKSFPIEFDKNGDLILKNIWNIDVDKEYNASHKILMNCTSNNLDSMKYEIAKLWMLNLIVEKKISKGDNSEAELKKLSDQRARILNDFNKYLKIVMKNDPDFVFGEYFENSPFNAGAIKITGNTVRYGAELLKSVILGRKLL